MAVEWMAQGLGGAVNGMINGAISTALNTVVELGKGALHATAPDNFEYYMCAFELFNGNMENIGFLTFPVMPNNIMETKTSIKTITKTVDAVVTLFNSSFTPRDISIQGTFGRKLRLLLGVKDVSEPISGAGFSFGLENELNSAANPLIRTGYGVMKIMKNIIDTADVLDNNGMPHFLVFHNYALNTHYIVEVLQNSYSQGIENNMLWFYNIEMKAVAPASSIGLGDDKASFLDGVVANQALAGAAGKVVNSVLRKIPTW